MQNCYYCYWKTDNYVRVCEKSNRKHCAEIILSNFYICCITFVCFRTYRLAAYRQFTLWAHGRLGRHTRRVIPACVVNRIREKFTEGSGIYKGFEHYQEWNSHQLHIHFESDNDIVFRSHASIPILTLTHYDIQLQYICLISFRTDQNSLYMCI